MFKNIYIHESQYYIWMAILTIGLISTCVISTLNFNKDDDERNFKNSKFRKITKNNVAKDILKQLLDEKMDFKKKKKIERYLLQSGLNLNIVDLYIISIGSSLLMAILMGIVFNNIFLVFIFLIVGFMAPRQFIIAKGKKRKEKLNTQVGTFINVVVARYEMLNDFSEALRMSIEECHGQQPIESEIRKTVMDLDLGLSVNEALDNLTLRTGNKHIQKLTNNYRVASNIGTKEARKRLLGYVIDEYNQQTVSEAQLRRELKGPVMDAYLMCAMVPGVMIMQAFLTEGYVEFMTQETLGKIGMTIIVSVLIAGIWFINAKVSAPIE